MNRSHFTATLSLLLLFVVAQARPMNQIRATGELKLATSADFEPFNFEKGGQMAGFEVELGNL